MSETHSFLNPGLSTLHNFINYKTAGNHVSIWSTQTCLEEFYVFLTPDL